MVLNSCTWGNFNAIKNMLFCGQAWKVYGQRAVTSDCLFLDCLDILQLFQCVGLDGLSFYF